MFEIKAGGLQSGDEFTVNQGETWWRVIRSVSANRGKKQVVDARQFRKPGHATDAEPPKREFIFGVDDPVVTR